MGIWKTAFTSKNSDRKYANNFDEVHRYCEGHYSFDVSGTCEELFLKIVNLSLLTMREKVIIDNLTTDTVLHDKSTDQEYLCNEFLPHKIYSLETVIKDDRYWTIFQFTKIKPNRTRITYLQRVKKQTTIGGAVRFLGKRTFLKNIQKKGQEIAIYLSQGR